MVTLVRLPRVLLGALVGGGLAVGGVALQAAFRNPLVSPQVIGVSSGASFGGRAGPGPRARHRLPRGVGVRVRDGRPRCRLPRHGGPRRRLDADDRPRGRGHRVVLHRPRVAADLPRGPVLDAAGHRLLAARQPGHGDLREGPRRRGPGPRRHRRPAWRCGGGSTCSRSGTRTPRRSGSARGRCGGPC